MIGVLLVAAFVDHHLASVDIFVVCELLIPFCFCGLDENHAVGSVITCFATFRLDYFAWAKHMRADVVVSRIW